MKLFARQVYVFGMSRITLKLLYPESLKVVHLLPAAFVIGSLALILLSIFVSWWFVMPLLVYLGAVFVSALFSTKSLDIALKSLPASIIQLGGYGVGFIRAYMTKIILRRGRDLNQEIAMRKGK